MGQVPFFFVKSDADSRYDNNWRAGQGRAEKAGEAENFRIVCLYVYLYVHKIPGKVLFCHKRRKEADLMIESWN